MSLWPRHHLRLGTDFTPPPTNSRSEESGRRTIFGIRVYSKLSLTTTQSTTRRKGFEVGHLDRNEEYSKTREKTGTVGRFKDQWSRPKTEVSGLLDTKVWPSDDTKTTTTRQRWCDSINKIKPRVFINIKWILTTQKPRLLYTVLFLNDSIKLFCRHFLYFLLYFRSTKTVK